MSVLKQKTRLNDQIRLEVSRAIAEHEVSDERGQLDEITEALYHQLWNHMLNDTSIQAILKLPRSVAIDLLNLKDHLMIEVDKSVFRLYAPKQDLFSFADETFAAEDTFPVPMVMCHDGIGAIESYDPELKTEFETHIRNIKKLNALRDQKENTMFRWMSNYRSIHLMMDDIPELMDFLPDAYIEKQIGRFSIQQVLNREVGYKNIIALNKEAA